MLDYADMPMQVPRARRQWLALRRDGNSGHACLAMSDACTVISLLPNTAWHVPVAT
jgi:hypothetical protein